MAQAFSVFQNFQIMSHCDRQLYCRCGITMVTDAAASSARFHGEKTHTSAIDLSAITCVHPLTGPNYAAHAHPIAFVLTLSS